jgi:hypothetical protein
MFWAIVISPLHSIHKQRLESQLFKRLLHLSNVVG